MSEKPGAGVAGKEVLYVDVDDEITSVIDKVRGSKQKIVALVLPKRATVFQSIVNMKLLKRAADNEKKNLVLITSETGLLPLAATVGLHVAKSLQSRPEIPEDALAGLDKSDAIEEISADGDSSSSSKNASLSSKFSKGSEPALDKGRTVGELAGAAALDNQLEDTIDLGAEDDDLTDVGPATVATAKSKKGKNKNLKVPNFSRFRILIIVSIVVLVALISGIVVAMNVLPKAKITIQTNSSAINSSSVVTLSGTSGATLDLSNNTVPAVVQQTQKTGTAQVAATGQQNKGAAAAGTVTMSAGACSAIPPADVPAGVGINASVNGSTLTFITQQDTSFNSVTANHKCTWQANQTTPVAAQQGGAQYNISPTTFTISGRSDVTASSTSPMSGGTDNIIKIVAQADIDSAKQKLSSADTTAIKQGLQSALQAKGLFPVPASFNAQAPSITTSANVGDTADTVTATSTTTYTMVGVKESDLQSIVEGDIKNKTSLKNQKILDYGLTNAVFGVQSQNSDGGATVTMQTTVVVGSELNTDTIKKQVAGMKSGDAQAAIKQYPGVTNVTVTYSPFWVNSIPKGTSKITVSVQKPTAASTSSNASKSQ